MTLLDKANIVYLWQDLFRYSNQQWTVLTIITWTRPLGWRRNASSTCWTAFSSQRRSQPLWPSWRRHSLRFVWKAIEVNDQNLYIQMEGSRVPHSKVGFSSSNQLVAAWFDRAWFRFLLFLEAMVMNMLMMIMMMAARSDIEYQKFSKWSTTQGSSCDRASVHWTGVPLVFAGMLVQVTQIQNMFSAKTILNRLNLVASEALRFNKNCIG